MHGSRLQFLTENDWVLVQTKVERRTYTLGQEIIRQGEWGDNLYIIRRGEASVELAGTGSRAIVALLGPEDVCGELSFIEQTRASAAVIAKEETVEADAINSHELRRILDAYPGVSARFYRSLSLVVAQRLRATSGELAREMGMRDRRE